MPGKTNIEWTDRSWNPTTGCTQISPGCAHCYAKTLTERFHGKGSFDTLTLHPDRLDAPLKWKKPSRVFVNSMSDLFHEDVPDDFIAGVFQVMANTPQHTYQVLTKRPERMREYMQRGPVTIGGAWNNQPLPAPIWPLPNVWLGCTVENQRWADERIPILLDTPAAVRFISAEPLLGYVLLDDDWLGPECVCGAPRSHHPDGGPCRHTDYCGCAGFNKAAEQRYGSAWLNWVIVGGESGPKHRPFNPDWARSIVAQCKDAGVACFVKQMGGARPGNKLEDLPEDLRVREYPV